MQHKPQHAIAVLEVEAKMLEAHAEKLSRHARNFDAGQQARKLETGGT